MSQPGTGRTKGTAPRTSLLDVIKVVLRLGPKQINDEIQLAIGQMKTKGVAAGIAVALMVVGVVFLTFLVVALIVAAVAAFALIFELWAAALIVAGIFLLIALIFALIGLLKFRKTLPLLPEDAIRGFRLDLGVAREGTRFDPQSLDQADSEKRRQKEESKRQAAEQAKKDAKTPGAGSPTPPTYSELLRRTGLRRDHLASLQDQITSSTRTIAESVKDRAENVKDKAESIGSKARGGSKPKPKADRGSSDRVGPKPKTLGAAGEPVRVPPAAEPKIEGVPAAAGQESGAHAAGEFVAARWKPLAVVAGSAAAGAVFLRELVKK
ncbi:phage holin family protein [Nesterenkonia sp. LB17]|uniref:phage holin family protein n=1 Tax=unclassified Nesterenkonia TaxID=2629769 RepID=UPI001F4D316B|nr:MULTISPECIES: phage holin family protein [unclassified Nesterenkonia]MCH8559756.1 phage holin family protein [Nesterenkonia sp. DZ6]MCH8561920.1 phage holin family protein [Nesterenkonia sp. YGD6]MCH8564543.1 phage holin family protein [Nesterenkonia sp. LB17]MCH8570169.1 phage holin family protein [Nesterenkonia sp. AY15]